MWYDSAMATAPTMTANPSLDRYTDTSPGQMGGKPRIAGRRITVAMIAQWHLEEGQSVERICQELPLTPPQVHAATAYYYDHKDEIERLGRRTGRLWSSMQKITRRFTEDGGKSASDLLD